MLPEADTATFGKFWDRERESTHFGTHFMFKFQVWDIDKDLSPP